MRGWFQLLWLMHAACGRVGFDTVEGDGSVGGYAAAVLADRPVAYWRLGESSGTVARDEVGGHPATYEGQCQLGVAGALGSGDTAVGFDGQTCRIVVGDAFAFDQGVPFTMELWAKIERANTSSQFLIHRNVTTGAPRSGYQLPFQAGALWFERIVGAGGDGYVNVGPPNVDRFEMIVVTYDGAIVRFYRDGIETGSEIMTMSTSPAAGTLVFGDTGTGVSFKLLGVLDEIAFYDQALSPSRVAAHFAAR